MITELKLGNFKAFAETQAIPIRPITLIYGPNSGGKSSIVHGLLYAREAMESGDLNIVKPRLAGESVDLGGFRQFIHRHRKGSAMHWGVQCRISSEEKLWGVRLKSPTIGVEVVILEAVWGPVVNEIQVRVQGETLLVLTPRSPVVDRSCKPFASRGVGDCRPTFSQIGTRFMIRSLNFDHPLFAQHVQRFTKAFLGRKLNEGENAILREESDLLTFGGITALVENFIPAEAELIFQDDHFSKKFVVEYPQLLKWLDNRSGSKPDWEALFKLATQLKGKRSSKSCFSGFVSVVVFASLSELLRKAHREVQLALEQLTYLGPLRAYPKRKRNAATEQSDGIARGEYLWDRICTDKVARKSVNSWLSNASRLSTPYELIVQTVKGHVRGQRPELLGTELLLRDKRSDTQVSHKDVGVGISQILPVLATAFGSRDQLHAIEQPELHLHPALQGELADVFIDSAIGERKNTFLLETHSEHLLLRIMRRMRETALGKISKHSLPVTPNDVVVLYVQPDGPRSIVRERPLNERGELIKPWPGGFFEEGLREVFA